MSLAIKASSKRRESAILMTIWNFHGLLSALAPSFLSISGESLIFHPNTHSHTESGLFFSHQPRLCTERECKRKTASKAYRETWEEAIIEDQSHVERLLASGDSISSGNSQWISLSKYSSHSEVMNIKKNSPCSYFLQLVVWCTSIWKLAFHHTLQRKLHLEWQYVITI